MFNIKQVAMKNYLLILFLLVANLNTWSAEFPLGHDPKAKAKEIRNVLAQLEA